MKIFSNMLMSDDSKVCPRCGKTDMWQFSDGMVKCNGCYLWGWLPSHYPQLVEARQKAMGVGHDLRRSAGT